MQTHREILKCLLSFDDAALKKINLYGLVKWRKVAEAFVGGEEIEFINSCVNKWMHCDEPRFEEVGTKYRVIRHKIKIGNVDIVAPEREALKEGENYFLLELGELDGSPIKWENDLHDNEWLKCGLIFLDAEDRNMARKAFTQLLGGE